jgi:L-alanine-DL-glutamate epimerase-like enolase superfamily enzyme
MQTVRLAALELVEWRIPLRFAFKHHLAERRETHGLLAVVRTACGAAGYGEALPRAYLTGETVESAAHDIQTRWWPAVRNLEFPVDAGSAHAVLDTLAPVYQEADAARKTASYAAIDIAIVDACARAVNLPGRSLWGETPSSIPLTATIPGLSARKAVWLARAFRWLGFRDFKLKMGRGDLENGDRLRAVRRAIGRGASLRIDANGAWRTRHWG